MKNKNNLILGLAAAGAVALSISMLMKSRKGRAGHNVHEMLDDISLRLHRFLAERNEHKTARPKQNDPASQVVS